MTKRRMECSCHDTVEEHIRAIVDAMPPLTDDQIARLRVLLRPYLMIKP